MTGMVWLLVGIACPPTTIKDHHAQQPTITHHQPSTAASNIQLAEIAVAFACSGGGVVALAVAAVAAIAGADAQTIFG